ncbi:MAG: hypothetical protein LBV19_02865 [Streptococcaceae bacterium]|nr:hypothetical protein [Streptococcaceae bacterium]
MKPFKTLEEQISHLEKNKSIIFDDKSSAAKYLLDENYFNVISCGKIKFADKIEKSCHKYFPHKFEDWTNYFELDCLVSEFLMSGMIEFERIINSRLSYFCCELIEGGKLQPEKRNSLIKEFQRIEVRNLPKYQGKETWKYVTKMSFGDVREILYWLIENQKSYYRKVVDGFGFIGSVKDFSAIKSTKNKLYDIVVLRNCLFHFTPLSIFLGHSKRRDGIYDNRFRKTVIDFIYRFNEKSDLGDELNEIYLSSDHFVAIKND